MALRQGQQGVGGAGIEGGVPLAQQHHGLLIARKHMGWTCQGFAGAPQLRHALMRAPTPGAALELLQRAEAAVQGSTSGQL